MSKTAASRRIRIAVNGNYQDDTLHGFAPQEVLAVVAGATLLGWLGAGAVTGHFLRQTRPTET